MDEDKDEKDKREFFNAVSKTSEPSPEVKQLIQAIEKQNETINVIAGKYNNDNRPKPTSQTDTGNQLTDNIDIIVQAVANKLGIPNHNQPLQYNHSNNSNQPFSHGNQSNTYNRSNNFNPPNNYQQYAQRNRQSNERAQPTHFNNGPPFQSNNQNRFNRTNQNSAICNHCNVPGHILQNCFKYQREQLESAKPPICYSCKGIGHLSTACPNKTYQANRPNLPSSPRNQGNE